MRAREQQQRGASGTPLEPRPHLRMAAAPAPAREPHLVSLKVLRAAKPSLAKGASPYSELESLAGPALAQLDHNSVRDGGDYGNDFSLSGAFILPSTFGTIYLGSVPSPRQRGGAR